MAYYPKLSDIEGLDDESSSYKPSLKDIEGLDNSIPAWNPSFAEKLAPNILAGLATMGHNVINAPHNIAKLISPRLASKIPRQADYDYAQLLQLPEKATLADKIVRGLAQYSPAMVMPVADMGIGGIEAGLAAKMAANAAPQALFGATQTENPLEGAAGGAIAGAASPVISGAINALRPSRLLRGNLSPEELSQNLEATKGTQTSLGRVIDSPTLNRVFENLLPHIIGSGAESTMQKTGNVITDRANALLEKVKGEIEPENLGEQLRQQLKIASNKAREEKDKSFDILNKAADKAGLRVKRTHFQKAAQEVVRDINKSSELKNEFDQSLYHKLVKYAKNPEGNDLRLTNIFRGKLGDKANEYYQNSSHYEHGLLSKLKEALSKDINESFEQSENKDLKELYRITQKNYQENYKPFEDKDIVKFTRKGGDPDLLLNHFLRGGKNDRATLLHKLTAKSQRLSQNSSKNLPLFTYLSRAVDEDGNINAMKLSQLYRNLGKNQKKAIFPSEELQKEFKKFSNLVGKNKEAFDLMRNPKTGARNTAILSKFFQGLGGYGIGGLPGIVEALGGLAISGRSLNKALTSEKLREKLVKKMIENKPMRIPGGKVSTGAASPLLTMSLDKFKGYQDNGT